MKRARPAFTQPERRRGGRAAAASAACLRACVFVFLQHGRTREDGSCSRQRRDEPAAAGLSCGYANVTAAGNRRFNHSSFLLPITSTDVWTDGRMDGRTNRQSFLCSGFPHFGIARSRGAGLS